MSRVQFISTKAASRLSNKLMEINQTGLLDKVFLDPDGYGVQMIPMYIELLEKHISQAIELNVATLSDEFKVPFDLANTGYMITKVIKEYNKRVINVPSPEVVKAVVEASTKYADSSVKAMHTAGQWEIAREAMYNASLKKD